MAPYEASEMEIGLEMLRSQRNSPRYPILPVKNYTGKPPMLPRIFGIVVQESPLKSLLQIPDGVLRVFLCNIFQVAGPEEIAQSEHFDYNSVEEFLAAGWMVD